MNVIPHISSGKPAAFKFIVKNHTAPEDVRYKETDTTLPFLDSSAQFTELPTINVGGVHQRLTFNNIIDCPTPNGTKLNTIVDICWDHDKGVGNKNIMEIEENIREEAISHVVISNITHLTTLNCLGPVTHVDPHHSSQKYKMGERHTIDGTTPLFGNTAIKIFDTNPSQCLLLSEAREAQTLAYANVVLDREQLEKELMDACNILVTEFDTRDNIEANGLRERSANLVATPIDVDLKITFIKENLEKVREIAQDRYDNIKEKTQQYAALSAKNMQETSELLDKCDAAVKNSSDINERLNIISQQIKIIFAFLNHNLKMETPIHKAEPAAKFQPIHFI